MTMALSSAELRDRFRATLLGCAIGDALGFPFEGAPPEAISRIPTLAEDYVLRPRGRFIKGQYTDDTQMTLAVAEAIIAEGRVDGRSIAQRFALLWKEGVILFADRSSKEAMERLLQGVPWMSAGVELGRAGNGPATRASPLGLWHYDQPSRIRRDAEVQGVITHKDPRAQAGGAAIAAAVALNLGEPLSEDLYCARIARVVSTLDADLASEIKRLPQLLHFEPLAAIKVIARAGFPPHYQVEWPGISQYVFPSVLMALYAFLRERDDFRAVMSLVLRAGGDTDSVASMAGAICGSRVGCIGLPARLRRGVLHRDWLVNVADRLFDQKMAQLEAIANANNAQATTVGVRGRIRRGR